MNVLLHRIPSQLQHQSHLFSRSYLSLCHKVLEKKKKTTHKTCISLDTCSFQERCVVTSLLWPNQKQSPKNSFKKNKKETFLLCTVFSSTVIYSYYPTWKHADTNVLAINYQWHCCLVTVFSLLLLGFKNKP